MSDFEQELHDGMLTFFAFPSSLAIRLEGEESSCMESWTCRTTSSAIVRCWLPLTESAGI